MVGIGLVCSVVMFNILCFFHCLSSECMVIHMMQNMVLVIGAQLFNREVVEVVVYNDVVKNVCGFKGIIKACGSNVIEGDG